MKKLIIIIGCTLAAQITYAGDGRYRIERNGATYTKTDTATGDFWILSVINNQWIKPEDIPVSAPTPETKPVPLPSNKLDDYEVLEKLPADAVILPPLPPGYTLDKPYVVVKQNTDGTIIVTKLPK